MPARPPTRPPGPPCSQDHAEVWGGHLWAGTGVLGQAPAGLRGRQGHPQHTGTAARPAAVVEAATRAGVGGGGALLSRRPVVWRPVCPLDVDDVVTLHDVL